MGRTDEAERVALAHRIKVSVEAKLADGYNRGTVCCPGCGHDGEWSRQESEWVFLCEDCGLNATGILSPSKSRH